MKFKHIFLLSFFCVSGSLSASSSAPETEKPYSPHLRIRGDLLYWVPEVSGLDSNFGSGSILQTTSGDVTTTVSTETDIDPSFQWNVGYRVSLGWQFDKNRWEVGGIWTDFQGFGHKTEDHAKWKVRLEQIDLATLYNVQISSVRLQPFIGLRGASIFQKLFSKVITDVVISGSGTATDTRIFDDRQQFYGLGPLLGLNTNYAIKHGLSFYGSIAFSLLYGNYHLHFDDSEVITEPATPRQTYSTMKKHMKAFDWDIDLALGIQWEYLIKNACCLTMKLGFENHQYFDQSRLGHTFGNLSFSGGVFSLGIAF